MEAGERRPKQVLGVASGERPRQIVVVLGMHRSGTSLCAHILSVLGFDMADEVKPAADNAKGHWERWELVAFHDRILGLLGRDWFAASHAFALPAGWWADPAVRAIRGEMIAWLRDRMGGARRFGFKDPRTALMLPLWREICEELDLQPRFVLCIRSPALVARSLAARGDVPDPYEGEQRWLTYNAQIAVGIGEQRICVLPFEDWFSEGLPNLRRLTEHLGLDDEADDPTMRDLAGSIADPRLSHHSPAPLLRNADVTDSLYRRMMASVDGDRLAPGTREIAVTCCRFMHFIEPVQSTAMRVASLEAQIVVRDAQIGDAAMKESALRAEMAVERSRAEAALVEVETLRGVLAESEKRIADESVRQSAARVEVDARPAELPVGGEISWPVTT